MDISFRSKSLPSTDFSRKVTRSVTRISETEPSDLSAKELETFKEIRSILSTPPFKRTFIQKKFLTQFLLQFEFFKEIKENESEEAVFECAKYLKHYFSNVKSISLQKEGEIRRFYLLLSGNVKVFFKESENSEEKYFVFEKFNTFGESFYPSPQVFYTSVICLIPSHFAILDSVDFKRIHDHMLDKKFQIVLNFLSTIPILSTLSRKFIQKILSLFKLKNYKRKEMMFRENDPVFYVYFIDEGEFLITKNTRISSNSPSRVSDRPRTKEYKIVQKLAILSKGEMIGDEDLLKKNERRSFNCECYSENGKVLCISAQDFFLHLAKTDEVIDILKNRVKMRELCRTNISRVSSEILKLRLPSPHVPKSPLISPRHMLKNFLAKSGHSTPVRANTAKNLLYYK